VGRITIEPTLERIREASESIQEAITRTPLVPLNLPDAPARIHLKLENLQTIGSFKIRAAAFAMAMTPRDQLASGVLTASAGNMGQAVAWEAARRGIACTVVVPDTAPQRKLEAMRQLGARLVSVPFDEWWATLDAREYKGVAGRFIHPFDDGDVVAADGTIGLEILEEQPDVEAIVVPWGGGGLSTGIAAAVKAIKPSCQVFAVEVEGAAPLAPSLEAGRPVSIEYRPSFVDGIGSKTVFPNMLELARRLLAGSLVTSVEETARCVRLLMERNHVVAEGAGAAPVAAALSGRVGADRIACVVSGGTIDAHKLATILEGGVP
jgi:threonine dehydratase